MIRKGYKFRRNENLTFRMADGISDRDIQDRIIPDNYVVIVRKKDCPIDSVVTKEDGSIITYINVDGIKYLPIVYHSRTNFIFGPPKKHEYMKWIVYSPIYWVEDGIVYSGRAYKDKDIEAGYIRG